MAWGIRAPAILAATLFALSGCISLPRSEEPPQGPQAVAPIGFPTSVRQLGADWKSEKSPSETVRQMRAAATDGSLNILALSSGGSSGAFGAGVLVGLTKSGTRPQFGLVTRVSAGSLSAPFPFLGPAGGGQLTYAFLDGDSPNL